jgi:hypothetical protein
LKAFREALVAKGSTWKLPACGSNDPASASGARKTALCAIVLLISAEAYLGFAA